MKRGGSYIQSPEWLNNKEVTIKPKNKIDDNNCFQYALTVALNWTKIGKNPRKISNMKPFVDQYNCAGIDFSLHSKDWEKFEQNNKTIALNILYVPCDTKEIRPAYISRYNYKRNDQVILLMITDGKKWHYLA